MQDYLKALPATKAREFQVQTVSAISAFLASQDLSDIEESPDLLDTLVETLRDAIMADPSLCLEHPALDMLFTLGKYGASSWQTTMLVNEAFDVISETMAGKGPESYAQLCSKVLPTLMGALDIGDMTAAASLSDMAVSLLSSLAEHGPAPLPQGFVATVMPKLYRVLFSQADFSLHQSATVTIRHILAHDPVQIFDWQDPDTGKGGLEITLLIIDRLLGPEVDDASAAEVGGLAVELVEKAGAVRLGPYLRQLLQVVAIRLSTADHANFIQNLVLVFARLAITSAREVVDFLTQVEVTTRDAEKKTGLEVVMRKWLENSATFSGYDAIRENIVALAHVYKLHDERLDNILVQGDLVVHHTSKIKTRSQAKKEPDQWSVVSVPLKIVKLLIQELASPVSPITPGLVTTQNGASDDEDDDWEDEPAILDLGAPNTRSGLLFPGYTRYLPIVLTLSIDLMSYADETRWNTRPYDDGTQKFLVDFFKSLSLDPTFIEHYQYLTDPEREKLQKMDHI